MSEEFHFEMVWDHKGIMIRKGRRILEICGFSCKTSILKKDCFVTC